MNQTVRGVVIFVSVLITIVFWMPLSNSPRVGAAGETITDTFFGLFRYATMHAVMKEPRFELSWSLDATRLGITVAITVVFWGIVLWILKRGNRRNAQ